MGEFAAWRPAGLAGQPAHRLAAPEGGRFVVDLTGVGYLDSAGLNVLFAHASRIQLIASPLLAPVLTVSGLSDITSVHEPRD